MPTLFAMMLASLALPIAPAQDGGFILANETGREIRIVELTPAEAGAWERPRDPRAVTPIPPGARATIAFVPPRNRCRFDLRTTFADNRTAVFSGIDLCNQPDITLRIANGIPRHRAD